MGIDGLFHGQFIDIVEWVDTTRDTIVCKFARSENEIQNGAQLVVREGQVAVFENEGKVADQFGPGTYRLETANLPILSDLKGWKYDFRSPFKAEVFFFNTRQFTDFRWGTQNPFMLRDREFGPIRLRAFGTYALQVVDPTALLRQLVGADPNFSTDEIGEYLRQTVVSELAPALASSEVGVLDLAANENQISATLATTLTEQLKDYGLAIRKFVIENISFPPEVEAALDKRTSMALIGNLNAYTQYEAATAVGNSDGGGGLGSTVGLGAGVAIGQQVAQHSFGGLGVGSFPARPRLRGASAAAKCVRAGLRRAQRRAGRAVRQGRAGRQDRLWRGHPGFAGVARTDGRLDSGQSGARRRGALWDRPAAIAGAVTTTPPSPGPAEPVASTPSDGSGGATAYRCRSCGATITYAAGTTDLVCPSCGSKAHISAPAGQIHEHSYSSWLATSPRPVAEIEKQHFECQSCGATTESGQIAGACPFCSGALVATSTPRGLIPPEAVVPFRMDKSAATTSFGTWIKSRWFAPKALKKLTVLQGGLQGVYTPHFTYDANTYTAYDGRRGVDRTETYTTTDAQGNSQTQTRTVIDWYPASGNVERFFNDVLIPGTTKVVPDKLAKAGPWALESSVPYQPEYLVGYSALRYDVDPPQALGEAKGGMAKVIEEDCRADIGGNHQRVTNMDTRYTDLMFKLLLLPIWIAAYSYRARTYQVIVNAQTGEVLGDRPYSMVKIALAIITGLILVAAIIALIAIQKHHGQTTPSGFIWPVHMRRLRTPG